MRSPKASASPSSRSTEKKIHNLRSSKPQSSDHISLSSKTPEKPPEQMRRTRNRGVALSISEISKVVKGLQDQDHMQQHRETTSLKGKSVRRRIAMPSPRKPKSPDDEPFKLPEKYEILGEFFDSLDSSIRLLRMKGSTPSFTNISPKIESLTDRRLTHGHLAQLKFILPEAIVINKILVFDERTSCMKPDLRITINRDAVESDAKSLPGSVWLRKLFRARLRDFCKSHPEGDEIPEEELPEPFNHPKLSDTLKAPSSVFPTDISSDACASHPPTVLSVYMLNNDIADNTEPANREKNLSVPVKTSIEEPNQQPAVASHVSKSFRRRFSQKSKENTADNIQESLPSDSFQPMARPISESSLKKTFHPITSPDKLASEAASSEICPTIRPDCIKSSSAPPSTPCKTIEYTENKDGSLRNIDAISTPVKDTSTPVKLVCSENKDGSLRNIDAISTPVKDTSNPVKLVCTPSRLMSATPAMPPPKRHYMTPDDIFSSSTNKLVRRPPRSRSLKFETPMKNKEKDNEDDAGGLSINDDISFV